MDRINYLSYFCQSGLFHILYGKPGFDAVVEAAQAAGYMATILVINTRFPESSCDAAPDPNRDDVRLRIVSISKASVSADRLERIKDASVSFLLEAGRISHSCTAGGGEFCKSAALS